VRNSPRELSVRVQAVTRRRRRLRRRKFAISGEQVYRLVYSSAAPQRFLAGTPTQAQRINRAMGGAEGPGFQNSKHRKRKKGSNRGGEGRESRREYASHLYEEITCFICLFIYLRLSLCLIKHHSKKPHEGIEIWVHAFITSAHDGEKWTNLCPGHFTLWARIHNIH
jgi:hypothetical protein